MMTLVEKIRTIYPELSDENFFHQIRVVNDGNSEYIEVWGHPTLTEPTQQELDAVTGEYVEPVPSNEEIYDEVIATQKVLRVLIEALNDGTFVPGANHTAAQIRTFIASRM